MNVALTREFGAEDSDEYTFAARYVGRVSCAIGGFFGVSLYDPAGALLTADDGRLTNEMERPIELHPGQDVQIEVVLAEGKCTNNSPRIGAFHFIPPNDTTFDQVSLRQDYQYCGGKVAIYPDRQ